MAVQLLRNRLGTWKRENAMPSAKPGRLTQSLALVVRLGKVHWNALHSLLDMMSGDPAFRCWLRHFRSATLAACRRTGWRGFPTLAQGFRDWTAPDVVIPIEKMVAEGELLEGQIRKEF